MANDVCDMKMFFVPVAQLANGVVKTLSGLVLNGIVNVGFAIFQQVPKYLINNKCNEKVCG